MFDDVVGVHDVVHRFRHLLHGPSADVAAIVFGDKFGRGIFGSPGAEGFNVKHIVLHDVHVHVQWSGVVGVLLAQADKGVGALHAVNEVGASLNHTLVDEFAEGLFGLCNAQVVEEFVPESAIDEVARGVLAAAHVEVHLFPVVGGLLPDECFAVLGVHVAEVVGRRTRKAGHRVEFEGEDGLVVNLAVLDHLVVHRVPGPYGGVAKGRFAAFGRQEFAHLGQFDGQAFCGHHLRHAVLIIYGEGFAPVALATEDGVAQAEVHLDAAQLMLRHECLGGCDGLLDAQAVEREAVKGLHASRGRVHHGALLGVEALLAHIGALDEGNDGQVEVAGKGVVARIVGGHGHDGTRAVACQHIVGNPNGYFAAREGVDGIRTREYARHAAVGNAFALGALLRGFEVGFHLGALAVGGQLLDEFALGGQHHKRHAKDGVGAGREDGEFQVAVLHAKLHLRAFAAANPVALCLLDRVGPVNGVQSVEQPLCVG